MWRKTARFCGPLSILRQKIFGGFGSDRAGVDPAVGEAVEVTEKLGLMALLYTSPSHTEDLPIPVMFNGNARACGNGTAVNEYQARHRSPN
jgi:hypothetical protein